MHKNNHIHQLNIVENQEINPHVKSINLQKGKNMKAGGRGGKTAYSVNGTRKTGQLHAKESKWIIFFTSY